MMELATKFAAAVLEPLCLNLGEGRCLRCNRPAFGVPVCRKCLERHIVNFEPYNANRCERCGKALISESRLCMQCRSRSTMGDVDFVFPLYPYRQWRKNLLFEWKMNSQRTLSPVFADVCNRALKGFPFCGRAVIVPVPPRPGKIRRTGWDQVDELSSVLRRRYGFCVERLLRRFSLEQQKKKGFSERQRNKGNYGLSSHYFVLKRQGRVPKEVVLLDDVITTGATVNECAAVLKASGVRKVAVLSLFIVD